MDCSVGKTSGNGKCHQTTDIKIPGDEMLASLPLETREVIMWQSNLTMLNVNATIYFHHIYVPLKRFPLQQRICCNPFDLHASNKKGKLELCLVARMVRF